LIMANFYKAKFISLNIIQITLFSEFRINEPNILLFKQGEQLPKVNITKRASSGELHFWEITLEDNIEFGKQYCISINNFPITIVDNSELASLNEFDDLFAYNGDDLGSIYSKNKTDFALWAPLATAVFLCIDGKEFFMERTEKGVYRYSYQGNHEDKEYHFKVANNGVILNTIDPYCKAVSCNSKESVVVDLEKIKEIGKVDPGFETERYTDAIIYELHVRDFTEGSGTDIVNKGTYAGLVEEGRKTTNGNFAGIDYLKKLGITHVQLQPIQDYRGVDDITHSGYNWGYDPIHYFAIEGSLAIDPKTPNSRMIEFKKMVNGLHKNHIKVNVDIVYNHIFEHRTSIFEKIVPGYYFRKKKNGEIYCSSGCGNDFATEKFMVRKLIVDSLVYLTELYDIDGYRFDLMGLIDKTTLDVVYEKLCQIKKDIMLYGEGWNMMSTLQVENKGCLENASNLPHYAFFNDMYRDIMKGGNSSDKIFVRGFCNGDLSYKYGFDFSFLGSVLKHSYEPRFKDASQSLNYVECHDNHTLFDKYCLSNSDEDIDTILRRIEFTNAVVILSNGLPFIHMGQEIGLSKKQNDNTYNVPKINNMDWNLVDERWSMVSHLCYRIMLRKDLWFLRENDPVKIEKLYIKEEWDNGVIVYSLNKDIECKYKDLIILFNPTVESLPFTLEKDYSMLLYKGENFNFKSGILPPNSTCILFIK